MKLISSVKLQKAQAQLVSFRPYSDALKETTVNLAKRCDPELHPLLRKPKNTKNLHLVFFTSDRGLCGSFNSHLIRNLENYIKEESKNYDRIVFSFIGRRGKDHFSKRDIEVYNDFIGVTERNFTEISGQLSDSISNDFVSGKSSEVILVYNHFKSALTQIITYEKLLPIDINDENSSGEENPIDYIYEPNRRRVLNHVLTQYIEARVERAIQESLTSEHAARMTAMENATSNADEVINKLTLLFNKTRQAKITTELMDIVNGTEALSKGGAE